MQPLGAKVDYHCIAYTGGAEIIECLGDVFWRDRFGCFQFNNEAVSYEQVSEVPRPTLLVAQVVI